MTVAPASTGGVAGDSPALNTVFRKLAGPRLEPSGAAGGLATVPPAWSYAPSVRSRANAPLKFPISAPEAEWASTFTVKGCPEYAAHGTAGTQPMAAGVQAMVPVVTVSKWSGIKRPMVLEVPVTGPVPR